MPERRPQINFQVDPAMKTLYEEAKAAGFFVTRLCAAGLLHLVENPAVRLPALNRLRDWEAEYQAVSRSAIRDFVQGAQAALRSGAPDSRRGRKARPARKKPKRAGS
ncbi:MAG: hypothetical protein KKB50_02785 [Planctomycetes bacterium]|nr:hypothetical protein [Planctomycetota bacterium]